MPFGILMVAFSVPESEWATGRTPDFPKWIGERIQIKTSVEGRESAMAKWELLYFLLCLPAFPTLAKF